MMTSIVFLNLYDATINTTVVECIGRNTPLIVNRLPGLEYLGEDYPLFYDTLEQASVIIADDTLLLKGIQYLETLEIKKKLTKKYFLTSLTKTAIYRSLPTPHQYTHVDSYDITVMITSKNKGVNDIGNLLDCFTKQDYTGSFEVILWNDNHETHQELATIVELYKNSLAIRLILSSDILPCNTKLVVARLMRSNYLLICHESIIPRPTFITTMFHKYTQYGPETALCCSGYVLSSSLASEENLTQAYIDDMYKKFIDESQPDRQVYICCTC